MTQRVAADVVLVALLAPRQFGGMRFGTLATVNGVGNFLSSVVVGVLWSALGTSAAFGYSAILFGAGAWLVLQISEKGQKPVGECDEWQPCTPNGKTAKEWLTYTILGYSY